MPNNLHATIVNHFGITFLDYPDPENYAVQIYFCGCDFSCSHCSNPELRDTNCTKDTYRYSVEELTTKIVEVCENNSTNHIVIVGGDSCARDNRNFTKAFVERMHENYNICIYTGYTIDDVGWFGIDGFKYIKCGTFNDSMQQISEKTDDYMQFASKNQILYDEDLNQLSNEGKYYFKTELI